VTATPPPVFVLEAVFARQPQVGYPATAAAVEVLDDEPQQQFG
jgi:hypothetical protein